MPGQTASKESDEDAELSVVPKFLESSPEQLDVVAYDHVRAPGS